MKLFYRLIHLFTGHWEKQTGVGTFSVNVTTFKNMKNQWVEVHYCSKCGAEVFRETYTRKTRKKDREETE